MQLPFPLQYETKTPASARHKSGCNCKKSSCLKKYCECFQVLSDSPLCTCYIVYANYHLIYMDPFVCLQRVGSDVLSAADAMDVKTLLVKRMVSVLSC